MLDGMGAEQFQQFIAPTTIRTTTTTTLPSFTTTLPLHHHHHHHHHHSSTSTNYTFLPFDTTTLPFNTFQPLAINPTVSDSWSHHELRITSAMPTDTCLPDLTWDHLSRKVGEEEESRYLMMKMHNNNNNNNNNEQQLLYDELGTSGGCISHNEQEIVSEGDMMIGKNKQGKNHRRSRGRGGGGDYKMVKGMWERMVKRMMEKQEEIHNNLMEEMVRREEEKVAREQEWKKQEVEKVKEELRLMAREQALAQASILQLLHTCFPTATATAAAEQNPSTTSEQVGRRWPRDEVVALINLRCKSIKNNKKNKSEVGPLWERISKGMEELGYKRSGKRCKEKWENINKYFRKTKDKRGKQPPPHSSTCPYFHHLTSLYTSPPNLHPSPPHI